MARTVFFSHATHEDGDFANRLASDLEQRAISVWIAPRDIRPGDSWPKAVESAIRACTYLLAILTPDAIASDQVDKELQFAQAKRKTIIPLMLKTCEMPFIIYTSQYIDFGREEYAGAFDKLVARLQAGDAGTKRVADPAALFSSLMKGESLFSQYLRQAQPLPAPKLQCVPKTAKGRRLAPSVLLSLFTHELRWEAVADATGYLLESASAASFDKPKEIEVKEGTSFSVIGLPQTTYYRLKAKGGIFRPDSPSSNVVEVKSAGPLFAQPLGGIAGGIAGKLAAPHLKASLCSGVSVLGAGPTLEWNAVLGASQYVLEQSLTLDFHGAAEIYKGPKTNYSPFLLASLRLHYRVKAAGFIGSFDSDWSNVVELRGQPLGLTKPTVRAGMGSRLGLTFGFDTLLDWDKVPGAKSYVVEASDTKQFSNPEELYSGSDTRFFPLPKQQPPGRYYRVKAKGGFFFSDSDWSDPVYAATSFAFPGRLPKIK